MTTRNARFSLFGIFLTTATLASCGGDETCGPPEDAASALSTTIGDNAVEWHEWRSSPNNDCGEPGGPVSLTLDAQQVGSNFALTFCLPRPDKLSSQAIDIGEASRVRLIDVFAEFEEQAETCLAQYDRAAGASGTIGFPGICGDGDGESGYGVDLDLEIPMSVTCGETAARSETMVLRGSVAVTALQF